MRNAFINTLIEEARMDPRIFLVVGDLGFSVVEPFVEEFEGRYINAGVAEQNMTGIAAGLALSGKIVFTYSIANFPTLRCLEQIRNDVCYHNANVKIVAVGAGLAYGSQGMTHFATEDIAIMRALPGMIVFSPCDSIEAAWATRTAIEHAGPCYLRLGKNGEPLIHKSTPNLTIGKAIPLTRGDKLTVFATGSIVYNTLIAVKKLAENGINVKLLTVPTIKPLDVDAIRLAAMETNGIVTVEEHSVVGGLGSAVAETIAALGCQVRLSCLGLKDSFPSEIGDQEYLRGLNGLSADGIYNSILKFYKVTLG